MGYEDFVWFIMSEEDKTSDMALDYWFKCCDLDGDGCLRANEMLVSVLPTELLLRGSDHHLLNFHCLTLMKTY